MAVLALADRLADRTAQRHERRAQLVAAVRALSPAQAAGLLELVASLHAQRAAERAAGGNVLPLRPRPEPHA